MATRFEEAAVRFVAEGSSLNKSLAAVERSVGESASRMASAVKTSMLAVSAAVVAGSATLAAMVKLSADAGDELAKMSQRVAISVETLSGYRLAADLAGTSLQDFGTSLQKASRNIVEASKGTGEAADAFDAVGIRVTDGSGRLKTAEQIMLEVADQFAQMEDGAQKTALAMDIFGKSGASMIPLLNQGSKAIEAQRKEAELLGVTWTGAQAKLAEALNDNITRVTAAFAGFRNAVSTYLFPFFTDILESILAKIKAWGADGTLKIWALQTGEAIIGAFAAAADAVAALVRQMPTLLDGFRQVMAGAFTLKSGFEALAGKIGKEFDPLWYDPAAAAIRDLDERTKHWSTRLTEASERSADLAVSWWNAVGTTNERAEKFAGTIDGIAKKFREWGAAAIATGSKAAAGISVTGEAVGSTVAKSGQLVLKSAKEQVKELEEAFKAASARGEASLYDVRDYMERRAELFRAGSKERIQAEAEAFKYAKDMADQLFAHQKALGLKSLEDELAHLRQKAAAAKHGSAERMKAEEEVYRKEEELRNKRQAAALGILGEVKERLEAKGYTDEDLITRDMVEREMFDLQAERGRAAAKAQRFAAGGGETLGDVVAGYQAAGKLAQDQAQQRELGGVGEILAGGAQVGKGPLTKALGGLGDAITTPDYWENAGTGMAEGYGRAMEDAYASIDAGLSKIEERVNVSSSRTAQTIYSNLEEYLVRRIMGQLDRN